MGIRPKPGSVFFSPSQDKILKSKDAFKGFEEGWRAARKKIDGDI